MGFLNVSLTDVEEAKPVPEGEYDLRIVSATEKTSKKGNNMVEVIIRVEDPDYPNAAPLRHYINEIDPNSEYAHMQKLDLRRFLECFGVPYDDRGFETEDLISCTGRALVVQEPGSDGRVYNRLRPPQIR